MKKFTDPGAGKEWKSGDYKIVCSVVRPAREAVKKTDKHDAISAMEAKLNYDCYHKDNLKCNRPTAVLAGKWLDAMLEKEEDGDSEEA